MIRILSDFWTAICPFENMYIWHCVYNAFSDTLSHIFTQNQLPQELERTQTTIPSTQIRKLRLGQVEWVDYQWIWMRYFHSWSNAVCKQMCLWLLFLPFFATHCHIQWGLMSLLNSGYCGSPISWPSCYRWTALDFLLLFSLS